MSNQIVLRQDSALAMENAIERYNMLVEFIRHIMQKDIDFGIIPGAGTKPTLYKPGAEKLNNLFSHYPTFSMLDKVLDFDNGRFYFQYQCDLYRIEDGKKVGSGNGSCNSLEVKYRYRQGERKCPACGKPTIIKGKAEYGGGWLCFAKKGGCGAKFNAGDPAIEDQQVGRIENTEPFDLVNTLDKMAQKRAFVAATLIACSASAFYTQDVEDMAFVEGEYRVVPEPTTPEEPPAASTMTLETAQTVADSAGVLYYTMTPEQLAEKSGHIAHAITREKAKKQPDLTHLNDLLFRQDAVRVLLQQPAS